MKKNTLFNIKGAGRTAIHDKGIRHTERELITKLTSLHLTIKIERAKAGLKNKSVLSLLHKAIKKARLAGLAIIHYTLEYDHVHLLAEVRDNQTLGKGMQSFGITFSKGINKLQAAKGKVFKTRYHLRKLKSSKEIKNVVGYILGNDVKHKSTSFLNTFNSLPALKNISEHYPGFEPMIEDVIAKSRTLTFLRHKLEEILTPPEGFHLKKLC